MTKWTIYASMCYNIGSVRKNNEDAYYFNGHFAPFSEMDQGAFLIQNVNAEDSLWAVCDGMGGQNNGEAASYMAASSMKELQERLRGRSFEATVQNWVWQASRAINEKTDGGGSTMVMLYCADGCLQTASIGDSRIYRFHNGQLIRITKDHSKVEMMLDAKMITPEEARTHPQKNVITRYLGMDSEYPCVAAIGRQIPLVRGDRYLLCSDGVTDMLTDEMISTLMAKHEDVKTCMEKIRDAIFVAGARDNLTAILLELEAEDEPGIVSLNDGFSDYEEPDDEPTLDAEDSIPEAQIRMDVSWSKDSRCEFIMHGMPEKLSLSFRR